MTKLEIHRGDDFRVAQEICQKWQQSINVLAEVCDVPAALIMRVDQKDIEVFLSSHSDGNPYEKGEKASLNTGLYCETVMDTKEQLLVPNALKDPDWNNNPDVKLNMISYLGSPLRWPDGYVFGTICILDCKQNYYSKAYAAMLQQFCQLIEMDLRQIVQFIKLENTVEELKATKSQLLDSQKIAAQTNVISGLAHVINTPIGISVTAASYGLSVTNRLLKKIDKCEDESLSKDIEGILESLVLVDSNLKKSIDIISRIKLISTNNYGMGTVEFGVRMLLENVIAPFNNELDVDFYKINLSCDKDVKIDSYPSVFNEIFTNLISNSIIHGFKEQKKGIINIYVEKQGGDLNIRYSDDGVGFSILDKQRLFEPFGSMSGAVLNMGLGLNIIYNKVTQDLKGSIDCKSEEGKGVLFLINLIDL